MVRETSGGVTTISIGLNRQTREPLAPFDGTSPEMQAIGAELRRRGLYAVLHWNTILIVPPLIIDAEQLAEGFRHIGGALGAVEGMG
jgi:taurine--2-oxoglutarate transaminase